MSALSGWKLDLFVRFTTLYGPCLSTSPTKTAALSPIPASTVPAATPATIIRQLLY